MRPDVVIGTISNYADNKIAFGYFNADITENNDNF